MIDLEHAESRDFAQSGQQDSRTAPADSLSCFCYQKRISSIILWFVVIGSSVLRFHIREVPYNLGSRPLRLRSPPIADPAAHAAG